MLLIPALDLLNGQAVRLRGGDFAQATVYDHDPAAVAARFAEAGATHMHVVDLDGARAGTPHHLATLRRITTAAPGLHVDFSGGLSSRQAVEGALAAGAAQVAIGSLALREPATVQAWLAEFGAEKLIIGADFRDDLIAHSGWLQTSETRLDAFVATWLEAGARTFLCTDISRDGHLSGPATTRYATLTAAFPEARILASGGVSGPQDLAPLRATGVAGVIIGKALYEGHIDLRRELAG